MPVGSFTVQIVVTFDMPVELSKSVTVEIVQGPTITAFSVSPTTGLGDEVGFPSVPKKTEFLDKFSKPILVRRPFSDRIEAQGMSF